MSKNAGSNIGIVFQTAVGADGSFHVASPQVKDFGIWLAKAPETQQAVYDLLHAALRVYYMGYDLAGPLVSVPEDPTKDIRAGGKITCILKPV